MNPIVELITKMADDALIYGHRCSEWTGIGPTLEEDIAFSSIAQDKVGYAWNLYKILNEQFSQPDPDQMGFLRKESEYKCCQLSEIYTKDYAIALVRHFFFDNAEAIRYQMLEQSELPPLANLAKKLKGEIKYHTMHANTWLKRLGHGNEESKARLQSAINELFPYALGIFEPGDAEAMLKEEHVFGGEAVLQEQWMATITPLVEEAGLKMPSMDSVTPVYGGRKGLHTEDLSPLLKEMSEVLVLDPSVEW